MFQKFTDKKKYCPYFQYLSIFSIISLVLLIISLVSSKKLSIQSAPAIVSLLIVYFQNRLLFSMCLD